MRHCGRWLAMAHSIHLTGPTPRAASTAATVSPSGMLCSPIAMLTSAPWLTWFAPPASDGAGSENERPSPFPSPQQCAVMIPTISIVFRASAPRSVANSQPSTPPPSRSSSTSRHRCVTCTKKAPATTPMSTAMAPLVNSDASCSMSKDAAIMAPHASVLATPLHALDSFPVKKNGVAPSPARQLATKVTHATWLAVGGGMSVLRCAGCVAYPTRACACACASLWMLLSSFQ
mmetsp:Transcript_10702/g.28618  ORF Transcript_10702/g.28618 Transcript_10702/m.28618 type:complete len:232 (+) Transcript_10702:326-1021(+)